VYIFRKFSFRHRRLYLVKRIKFTEIFVDIFRTLFVTFLGASIVYAFWVQDEKIPGYLPSLTKVKCVTEICLLGFSAVELFGLTRRIFFFALLYHVRKVLKTSFSKKIWVTIGFLLFSACAFLFMAFLVEGDDLCYEMKYGVHNICVLNDDLFHGNPFIGLWLCMLAVSDIVIISLYIHTLYKLDLVHGRTPKQVRTYSTVKKDSLEPLLEGKEGFHAVSLTSCKERANSTDEQGCTSDFLKGYHHFVLRNLYSGVVGTILYLSNVIALTVVCYISEDYRIKYSYKGVMVVHYTLTYFLIYLCMVLSSRDWQHICIPCVFKTQSRENDKLFKVPTTNSTIQQ